MIILPVCSFEDVAYGTYDTYSCISIISGYGRELYAKALGNSHQKQHCTKIRYCVCGVRKQDTLFDAVEFQQRYNENNVALGDACLTHFPQTMQ